MHEPTGVGGFVFGRQEVIDALNAKNIAVVIMNYATSMTGAANDRGVPYSA